MVAYLMIRKSNIALLDSDPHEVIELAAGAPQGARRDEPPAARSRGTAGGPRLGALR
jgi:hypothetical protein